MIKLPKIPPIKVPPKEELEYQEKAFLLALYEQWQASSKIWFYALGAVLLLSFPLTAFLGRKLTARFIGAYQPPVVVENPYHPQAIKIFKAEVLPVTEGIFSVYTQVFNPNSDFTAHKVKYRFWLKDSRGEVVGEVAGGSFIPAGESKYFLASTVRLPNLAAVELVFDSVRWTKRRPQFAVDLEILQERTGVTPEQNFYVEGLLKNLQDFAIKKVDLAVLVFDRTNQNIMAVNATTLDDLKPLESRYFRLVWPKGVSYVGVGEIQVLPYVDLLAPGLILEEGPKIPSR